MDVKLRRRIGDLEQQLRSAATEKANLRSELAIALERQTITAQILNVISMSRTDLQPVFDVISESSRRPLGGQTALVTRVVGDMLHLAACTAGSRASHEEIRASFPALLTSSGIHSRAAMNSVMEFRSDIETEPGVPEAVKEMARTRGYRSIIVVPMLCEGVAALSVELTDELNDALMPVVLPDDIRDELDELRGLLKDNLQKILQHGRRADSIVKNMLLHSRGGGGEHRPTDVNTLVEESLNLALHGARAEKPQFNVTLRRDFDRDAGVADVFPQEITRVLLNLISNGFYAVSERREDSCPGFEAELCASTRTRGEHVEIRIRDNGAGIPPEVKEKMFHPWELLPSRSPASTSRHVLFTGRRQSGWQNVRPDSRLRTLPLGCSALPLVAGASSRRVS